MGRTARYPVSSASRPAPAGEVSRAAAIDDRRPQAAAQRALRRTIDHGPKMAAQRSIVGQGGVVQRSVGFEFEIGDILTQHWGMTGWGRHAKGALLQQLPGYKLTADDDGPDSRLEVIIDPFDETAMGAAAAANALGVNVQNTINTIAAGAHPSFPNYRRADQIPGLGGSSWDRYRSQSNSTVGIQGQLQMTGGVSMAKLHDHATGAQATNYLATLNPMVNQDDAIVHGTLANYTAGPIAVQGTAQVNAVLGGLPMPPAVASMNQLGAIVGMMATIPINCRQGGHPLDYAKAAAGPLMARTDYAKIMTLLPADIKGVLTGALMEQILLQTINAMPMPGAAAALGAGDPVIPTGSLAPNNRDLSGLTIGDWARSVVPWTLPLLGEFKGTDKLTKAHFPSWTGAGRDLESLGGYGDRVDPGNRPIVEFRSLMGVFADDLPGQLQRLVDFLNHP